MKVSIRWDDGQCSCGRINGYRAKQSQKVIAGLEGVFANETMGAFQLTRVKDQVCVRPWDSVTKVTENKK